MKIRLLTIVVLLTAISHAFAQEYKVAKATGRLLIKLPSVTIEGYDGKEIIFTSEDKKYADERAAGLRLLSGTGVVDNTNIGINVADKGTTIEVNEVASNIGKVKIKVPRGVSVSYNWQNMINAGKVIIKNITKEIDISVRTNSVELEDITGPVTVNSIYGNVKAKFKDKIAGPITISSMYATVDVAVPGATKANLKLNTTHGNVFASSDLNIELKKRAQDDEMVEYTGNIAGTLNGGGTEFNLTSTFGKVYLRKAI
ncbi:DUF4097 family beta strand repeat-containing protein [Mucilaginibacter aquatilis]|uniref:Uncharacterized protein n=1 Tax=Mucilaginibacter aquatilis TaxID=1517760 RepID=A0A6I4IC12_9SPHI|nr:DUF4097 family beta strand repeat-containing protein [Mucilaginibacter aquatilis]MVN92652.1 hypothetical protein [Mucilaginibacter aquatilis]